MAEPNYDTMTDAELEAALADNAAQPEVLSDTRPTAPPEPPRPEPEAKAEPEPEPEPEPEVAKDAEKPLEDDEVDLKASDDERTAIEREKWNAEKALLSAHSSRLAGEVGFLRKELEAVRQRPTEPYQPESPEDENRLVRMERELQAERTARIRSEVAQAVKESIAGLDAPDLNVVQAEISLVAPKYREQFTAALESQDPALARQIAEAVGRSVIADAKELAWTNRRKALEEKKAAQADAMRARKKAAAVSGGGAASAARPATQKSYEEMTQAELDAEMDKVFGRRQG